VVPFRNRIVTRTATAPENQPCSAPALIPPSVSQLYDITTVVDCNPPDVGICGIAAKGAVLALLRREEPAAQLARRFGVSEQTLYRWRVAR
jgi:hypothetical protein